MRSPTSTLGLNDMYRHLGPQRVNLIKIWLSFQNGRQWNWSGQSGFGRITFWHPGTESRRMGTGFWLTIVLIDAWQTAQGACIVIMNSKKWAAASFLLCPTFLATTLKSRGVCSIVRITTRTRSFGSCSCLAWRLAAAAAKMTRRSLRFLMLTIHKAVAVKHEGAMRAIQTTEK